MLKKEQGERENNDKKYECWGQNGGAIVGHDYIYKSSDSCNLDQGCQKTKLSSPLVELPTLGERKNKKFF